MTANFRITQQHPSSFHNGYNPKSLGRLTFCGSLCRRRPCVTTPRRLATCTSPVRRKTSGVTSAPTGCRSSASPGTTSQRTTPWRVPCPGPGEKGKTFQINTTLLCHWAIFSFCWPWASAPRLGGHTEKCRSRGYASSLPSLNLPKSPPAQGPQNNKCPKPDIQCKDLWHCKSCDWLWLGGRRAKGHGELRPCCLTWLKLL